MWLNLYLIFSRHRILSKFPVSQAFFFLSLAAIAIAVHMAIAVTNFISSVSKIIKNAFGVEKQECVTLESVFSVESMRVAAYTHIFISLSERIERWKIKQRSRILLCYILNLKAYGTIYKRVKSFISENVFNAAGIYPFIPTYILLYFQNRFT